MEKVHPAHFTLISMADLRRFWKAYMCQQPQLAPAHAGSKSPESAAPQFRGEPPWLQGEYYLLQDEEDELQWLKVNFNGCRVNLLSHTVSLYGPGVSLYGPRVSLHNYRMSFHDFRVSLHISKESILNFKVSLHSCTVSSIHDLHICPRGSRVSLHGCKRACTAPGRISMGLGRASSQGVPPQIKGGLSEPSGSIWASMAPG